MKVLECLIGSDIRACIRRAIEMARREDDLVSFRFIDSHVLVRRDSDPGLIYRDWERAMSGFLGKDPTVGPYPKEELSADDQASDDVVREKNRLAAEESSRKWEEEQRQRRERYEAKLAVAPPLIIIDQEFWDSIEKENSDSYGAGIVEFARSWGRLVQGAVDAGESFDDVVRPLSFEADVFGMSGSSYGFARSLLVKTWVYGDRLEKLRVKGVV